MYNYGFSIKVCKYHPGLFSFLTMAEQRYLEKIYYNPAHPASYQGPRKLFQVVKQEGKHKITFKEIKEWLQNKNLML